MSPSMVEAQVLTALIVLTSGVYIAETANGLMPIPNVQQLSAMLFFVVCLSQPSSSCQQLWCKDNQPP